MAREAVVFLFDVDNTLLDNDRVVADMRRFLERKASPQLTLRQVDPLIRELSHYRDLIDRRSQGDPT